MTDADENFAQFDFAAEVLLLIATTPVTDQPLNLLLTRNYGRHRVQLPVHVPGCTYNPLTDYEEVFTGPHNHHPLRRGLAFRREGPSQL